MANWQCKINIVNAFQKFDEGDIEVNELAVALAKEIRNCSLYKDEDCRDDLEDLAFRFDEVYDIEDFDDLLADLYDYGDYENRLWIDTMEDFE